MPTLSIAGALLVLAKTEDLPWTASQWQVITQIAGVPWHTASDAALNAPAPNVPSWTTQNAQSVEAYAVALANCATVDEQIKLSKLAHGDNQQAGRKMWGEFFNNHWTHIWKMPRIIDQAFKDCGCSPYDAMGDMGMQQVSPLTPTTFQF